MIQPINTVIDTPRLQGVFSDIDDTLTIDGQLTPDAFVTLSNLRQAGIKVILVTGRPAGWVDHIARMWPVDGVVGENGGLWFYMDGDRLVKRYVLPEDQLLIQQTRLKRLGQSILDKVPGAALASDQAYRALDLAIDFCEDVPALSPQSIATIVDCFHEVGATCKVSSIHVNGWFGSWDKLSGCEAILQELWGESLMDAQSKWVYFGDSANDEPMFEAFPFSVGVANVAEFLPMMKSHPKWITNAVGGLGFVEGIKQLFPHLSL